MGGFEVVDPRFRELHDRAVEVLSADERVAEVRVGGSIAHGTADEWSDLDLTVVAVEGHQEALAAAHPSWLDDIGDFAWARSPLAPWIINTVTHDGLTFDIAIYDGEAPPEGPLRPPGYFVGMMSPHPFPDIAPALEYAMEERFRGLAGPFVSLLQRGEHVRHLQGVGHALALLLIVFLAETGAAPPAKHLNVALTDEQRDAVAQLPPVAATRDSLIGFELAIAGLMVTRARPLYPQLDLEWPAQLIDVAARRIEKCLGVTRPGWMH